MADQFYNVWYIRDSRWATSTWNGIYQVSTAPRNMDLAEATAWCASLNGGLKLFEVRPLGFLPVVRKGSHSPAGSVLGTICLNCKISWGSHYGSNENGWECPDKHGGDRPIPHGKNGYFQDPNDPAFVPVASGKAINDYTCPACKNDRCSKSEKTCWKCGNKL